MVLDPITEDSLFRAAKLLQQKGVPNDNQWAEYWVIIDNKEVQFKHLIRTAYKIATSVDIDENKFTSSPFTRGFIQKKFGLKIIFKIPESVDFFKVQEIEFFSEFAGKEYRKNIERDKRAGDKIKSTIFRKTNTWARMLNREDFEVEVDSRWQVSGYFKPYSWARLCRSSDKSAKVFFTVGVSSERKSLVYKIDCQRKAYTRSKSLATAEVTAFDRVVSGTGGEWNEISLEELPRFNWEILYNVTHDFIDKYSYLYDEAVQAVKSAKSGDRVQTEPLQRVTRPPGIPALPNRNYSFKGVTIDYDAQNRNFNKIGLGGENLVINLESKILRKAGRADLADKVDKVDDGRGFDVLSFNTDGTEKHIEVKTTSGTDQRPFYMSHTEWAYMKENAERYQLYRVFDYDHITGTGKFFVLEGDIADQVLTREREMEVFIKSK